MWILRVIDFTSTIELADNFSITDPSSDPPETLAATVEKFSKFLAALGYPDRIRLVRRDNILVDEQGWFWRRECGAKALEDASLRYSQGICRNLGVALQAACATDSKTFASVYVPMDDLDAQYHLMGRGLKLSCPTSRRSASIVTNPLRWLILELRHKRRSKMLEL